jgi:hypothetical protein
MVHWGGKSRRMATVIVVIPIATSTSASATTGASPASTEIFGCKDTRWAANSREEDRTVWTQLFGEQVDSRQRAVVLYIVLAFLGERAVISGTRDAVGVREHASTNALASYNINGNRLKGLVRKNYTRSRSSSPPASFSSRTGPPGTGTKSVPLM